MGSDNYKHPDEDIELTPEETQAALLKAKIEKGARLRELAYLERISKPKEYPVLDANSMYNTALYRLSNHLKIFKNDDDQVKLIDKIFPDSSQKIFKALCLYFAGDKRAETEHGLKLHKGIMIQGPVGCGKTTMMRAFASNSFNPFSEVSCRQVADDYSLKDTGGALAIDYYSSLKEVIPDNYFGHRFIGFFFDDLGTENVKKHFGNQVDVMEEVILNRYDNPSLKGKTHFTTNLSADDIGDIYGARVRSRLREMVNVIDFDTDSPDRRS